MKNYIEVAIPTLIEEQPLKDLARSLRKNNKVMNQYENRMEEKAYEACLRQTSITLHKRLYWRSPRPKWPMRVESECLQPKRREKVLKRLQRELNKAGYATELKMWRLPWHGSSPDELNLFVLGLK